MAQVEEASKLAKGVEEPKNKVLIEVAKNNTAENIIKEMGELKLFVHGYIDSIADKLLNASRLFSQLQDAVVVSQNQLQSAQNIQVAADALDYLVKEYEIKKRELEIEHQRKQEEFESVVSAKRRDWQRETEEYSYTTQLKRRREKEQFEEELAEERKLLEDKEVAIKSQENEIANTKIEMAGFEQRLEREVAIAREKVAKELEHEYYDKLALLTKEKENENNISKLKVNHLEESNKIKAQEIEKAYAQSQNMALKLIESSSFGKNSKIQDLANIQDN